MSLSENCLRFSLEGRAVSEGVRAILGTKTIVSFLLPMRIFQLFKTKALFKILENV